MKIAKVMSRTRTTNVDSVLKQTVIRYKKNDWSTDVYLTGIFGTLTPLSEQMTDAINRIKAESNLEDKDGNRDSSIRDFFALIDGYCAFPDEAMKAAATAIRKVLDNYGLQLIHKGYDTESSLVDSLLNDLSKDEMVAHLETLAGTTTQIEKITAAQQAFITADVAFEDEKTKAGRKESASDIKKDILDVVNGKLDPYLNVMADVNSATYSDFATTLHHIIADSNEIVKKHLSALNN